VAAVEGYRRSSWDSGEAHMAVSRAPIGSVLVISPPLPVAFTTLKLGLRANSSA
jgi:hypothetical protein